MAIWTWAASPPTTNSTFSFSISSFSLGADCRLELIVAEEHLDLPAEHAAAGVDLLHGQDRAALLVGGDGAERPGEGERESDLDGAPALGSQDRGEPEGRGAEGRGGQKCASLHGSPPCRGIRARHRRVPGPSGATIFGHLNPLQSLLFYRLVLGTADGPGWEG
jgi:hypothetical protein